MHRTPDKAFSQSGTKNPTSVLYRLERVRAAISAGRIVYLVEGEKDVHALETLGVVATTSPMGAGNWSKVDATPLRGGTVVIVPDRDEPGERYAAEARAETLRLDCKVSVAHPAVGKDAADHVSAGLGIDDLEAVPETDGAQVLAAVEAFLGRFVAFPDEHCRVAVTLWAAHTHAFEWFESTPRLALLSPEPGSGKTRVLEVLELLVPTPVLAVNVTPAYLFRKVGDEETGRPTILFDEIDTVFGPKARDSADVRGLLNAGHRRGAVAGRCVVRGKQVFTEELPAFAPVAMAGLGDLPDTLMSRSVIIRMRRRAASEVVEPFRHRVHADEGWQLRDELGLWAEKFGPMLAVEYPKLPDGIADRNADMWEPLIAIADAAGGAWPERARVTAVTLVTESQQGGPTASLGIRLLADLHTIFTNSGLEKIPTADLLEALVKLDEAPWGDLRGKPLDARGLARRLSPYGVKPATHRVGEMVFKGYVASDLHDPWSRYLGSPSPDTVTSVTAVTGGVDGAPPSVTDDPLSVTDDPASVTNGWPADSIGAAVHDSVFNHGDPGVSLGVAIEPMTSILVAWTSIASGNGHRFGNAAFDEINAKVVKPRMEPEDRRTLNNYRRIRNPAGRVLSLPAVSFRPGSRVHGGGGGMRACRGASRCWWGGRRRRDGAPRPAASARSGPPLERVGRWPCSSGSRGWPVRGQWRRRPGRNWKPRGAGQSAGAARLPVGAVRGCRGLPASGEPGPRAPGNDAAGAYPYYPEM